MHDGGAPGWRQTIDRHAAALADDLNSQIEAEVSSNVARAVSEERARGGAQQARMSAEAGRRLAEQVNQAVRRLRGASESNEIFQLIAGDTSPWAQRAVVLSIENNQARVVASRGVVMHEEDEDLAPIELSEAAAIASCVETRDPVVALAVAGEISSSLAFALDRASTEKVYLFPVLARLNAVGVVVACGDVYPAPIELLCETAGMKLELLDAPVAVMEDSSSLVQITPAVATQGKEQKSPELVWAELTPEDQALHLKAQRSAKVRVAQMRISESDSLRAGQQSGDIYGALRTQIDSAREEFRQAYILRSPTMVDYLHLEMTRSLAREDGRLMGRSYPGPIA